MNEIEFELNRKSALGACACGIEFSIGDQKGTIRSGEKVERMIERKRMTLKLVLHATLGLGKDAVAEVEIDPPTTARRVRVDFAVRTNKAAVMIPLMTLFKPLVFITVEGVDYLA